MVGFPTPFCYCKIDRLLRVRSPLLTESHLMSFPRGTEMFHFSRFALHSKPCNNQLMLVGFPHSEIAGPQDIATSPTLIAGYHVFHRLWLPRHPPCALHYLTIQPQVVWLLGSLWCVWVMCNDSPMFTLDSVLFTFLVFVLGTNTRLIICWN